MENAFGKIIAILILITMLFIIPIKYGIEKSEELEEMYVSTKTIELVDSVRNTGFITKNMYDQYLQSICRMNRSYDVRMEHIIYDDPPAEWEASGNQTTEAFLKTYIKNGTIEEKIYGGETYKFKIEDYFKIQVFERTGDSMVSYYGASCIL